MHVRFHVKIGQSNSLDAFKDYELEFLPTIGMKYRDDTWASEGRRILDVALMFPTGDKSYVLVTLEPDNSDTTESLQRKYKGWEWKVF